MRTVPATTAAGLEITLAPALVQDFRARLRGPLLLPGEAGYDEARAIWNAMIYRRPAFIAGCLGVADVVMGVRFAREHGLLLSIKGGGHNIAGLVVCDGGAHARRMRGPHHACRAGPGRLPPWAMSIARPSSTGLAAVFGFVPTTGISGFTLGGGSSYLTRRFGWACANIRALEVVTAEGRVVRATADERADLFWGVRGDGGNFGVVTSIDDELYPVGPEVVGGYSNPLRL